jgi:hypothetical protein
MNVSILVGKTLRKVEQGDESIVFVVNRFEGYRMAHHQDCCENVYIKDITGDLDDLVGTPIIEAREDSRVATRDEASESGTWTFYNFRTIKGSVTITWLGESNGYYSESVDFDKGEIELTKSDILRELIDEL